MAFSIGLWVSEEMERVPDVSLVRRNEWAGFADLCKSDLISTPKDAFIVEPNGEKHSELLSTYVGETKYPSNYTLSALGGFSQIFSLWVKLLRKIDSCDAVAAALLCEHIQDIAQSHTPEIAIGLREMKRFIEIDVAAVQTPSLFRTYQSDGSTLWWLTPIACTPEMEQFVKSATVPNLAIAADMTAKRLKAIAGMPTASKFFQLSALCLGLAKRRLASGEHQIAFLLTYRALDLYFQYLGLSHGVLIETATGLRYKSGGDRVYLVESEYQLVIDQHLASDVRRKDMLIRLNTIRNELLQTHGAHHVSPTEAALAISQAVRMVSRSEGNSRWEVTADGYFPQRPSLRLSIFEMLPDIATYLEHVGSI